MKRLFLLFFFCWSICRAHGQVNFRTIAPQDPVVAGESFEVQYILEGDAKPEAFMAPGFAGFRVVAGPHVYKGTVVDLHTARPLTNTVYTLTAPKPGKYIIHGARIIINGDDINSNDVFIQVISAEEAAKRNKEKGDPFYKNSEYFLRPGEDPMAKMRRNLFLKVAVDRRSCYVGEPVTATFKLYSRLESKSDIVKNPGFYGFAVHDMINLSDKKQQTETVNGKTFDVHTIRKVQLYPLQAGQFTIDAMEISNKVEFSRSGINKKTEQEIIEGVLGSNDDEEMHTNTEVYENTLKTETIPISVKSLPAKNKTDSFTAAVGNFSITAEVKKREIAKNEQDSMVITISGEGNFTQINPPDIQWPEGIEGFEPVIEDSLDKLHIPLAGRKVFRYSFISARPGLYELPVVTFSFFNPASKKFETGKTTPLQVQVSNREKEKASIPAMKNGQNRFPLSYWWIAGAVLLVLLLGIVFLLKNRNRKATRMTEIVPTEKTALTIDTILQVPQMMLAADDVKFYAELHNAVWVFFRQKTNLAGSKMNKNGLSSFLRSSAIEEETIDRLVSLLQQCEAGMYTTASLGADKKQLLDNTRQLLALIQQQLG